MSPVSSASPPAGVPRAARPWSAVIGGAAAGVAAGLILASGVALAWFVLSGGPVANEWDCIRGEYPATSRDGGRACFSYGEHVPSGWTADPAGNQPLGVRS